MKVVVVCGLRVNLCTFFAGGRARWEWYKYLADPLDTRSDTAKWVAACEKKQLFGDCTNVPSRRDRSGHTADRGVDYRVRPQSAPPVVVANPPSAGASGTEAPADVGAGGSAPAAAVEPATDADLGAGSSAAVVPDAGTAGKDDTIVTID